jgi:hypothetical protein
MDMHLLMTPEAIESNIEYFQQLYKHHSHMAREYNRELWYWIMVLEQRHLDLDLPL